MASIYNSANGLRSDNGNLSRFPSRFPQNVNHNIGGPQNVDFGPDVFLTNEVHEINDFGKPLSGGYDANSDPFSSKYGLSGMQSSWKNNSNMMSSGGGYPVQNGLQLGQDYQQSSGSCSCGSSHHQGSRNFNKNNYNAYDDNNGLGRNPYNYNMNNDEKNVDYGYGGFGF